MELKYHIDTKLTIAQITWNVVCPGCGAVIPMMVTPAKVPAKKVKKEIEEIKEKPNYIG